MSDIAIPGVGAGNYSELVEKLMHLERIPREKKAVELEKQQVKNEQWQIINRHAVDLKNIARDMYSFNNPFVEKSVESSNEKAISATAKRDAREQRVKLSVSQIAKPDSFLTKQISKDFTIPKGLYTFNVGEKTVSVKWKGGNYKEFMEWVNKTGKNVIHVSEIKTTSTARSLLFESQLSGAENKLTFSDDALSFALESELIKKNDSSVIEPARASANVRSESSDKIEFSKPLRARDEYMLEFDVTVKEDSPVASANSNAARNELYEQTGSISYKGIIIQNEKSELGSAAKTKTDVSPSHAQGVVDFNILSLESTRGTLIPLPPLADSLTKEKISIPLSEYGDIKGLVINNHNSNKQISIENIKVFDPKATGTYIPVHPVSQAQDAIFNFEGIKITRTKNDIDDLIPGVVLHLHDQTDKNETISIEPDREVAKNAIIEFVAKYNRLLAEINIATARKDQTQIVNELLYLSEDERDSSLKRLGSLSNETTLKSLQNSLRVIMSNNYKTPDDSTIKMLSQIGISTKSDNSASLDASRLRGYLEIQEKELDEALKTNMNNVRALFGNDTDGDLLVDTGIAHQLFTQIDPYVQRGGIFSSRTEGLAGRMKATQKQIDEYDKKLVKKEQELKRKYGAMDGNLKQLQKQSDAIKNFSRQNNNNNNQ